MTENKHKEQFKEEQLKKLAHHLFQLIDHGGTYTAERVERMEYEIIRIIRKLKTGLFYGGLLIVWNTLTILFIICWLL